MPVDMTQWFKQAKDLGAATLSQATDSIGAGYGFIRESVGGWWLFGSTETSGSYDGQVFDEKHYFLVTFHLADSGYSLYSMRCLPEGVPPINDLPKRRIFHMPNEHAGKIIEQLLLHQVRETVEASPDDDKSVGSRLIGLADQIDKLDGKVFQGVLLVGGLVSLINPLIGAGILFKALLPSLGMLFSKFGLKYAGESYNARTLESKIRAAEKDVLKQFRGSETRCLVNPLLQHLDRALRTDSMEFDPLVEFSVETPDFGEGDKHRLLQLTCRAITNVYQDVLPKTKQHQKARLGPEDIRWLQLIQHMAQSAEK